MNTADRESNALRQQKFNNMGKVFKTKKDLTTIVHRSKKRKQV